MLIKKQERRFERVAEREDMSILLKVRWVGQSSVMLAMGLGFKLWLSGSGN